MRLSVLVALGVLIPHGISAQGQVLKLDGGVELGEFSHLRGFRELSDGKVYVTDWVEQRLVLLDFDRGTMTDIGRQGQGPDEYRLPSELVPLPADSTLMVDVGNARLTVVAPNGQFARTISTQAHGAGYDMRPQEGAQGYLYFMESPWTNGPPPADSVGVFRWAPATGSLESTGATVKFATYKPPRPSRQSGIPVVMFAGRDSWTVTPDGSLVVVRSQPYRVEWYRDTDVVVGSPVDYQVLEVTMDDRRDAVRQFQENSYVAGRGGGAALVSSDARAEREVDRLARTQDFAEVFPPFEPGNVFGVAGDSVWVKRYLRAGSPATYDVFDGSGRRTSTVVLPSGHRIIGFGRRHLYVVRTDDVGLQTIIRYPR